MPAKQRALNQHLSWATRKAQLQQITQWQLNGAVAIRTPHSGQSASLAWQQHQYTYQIDVFGPLGAGRATLNGDADGVTLLDNGKRYQSPTTEILMQKILGWHIPVSNLYFWIRGLPAPHLKSISKFDAYHHLVQLKQQAWEITYQQYTGVNGIDLPRKLTLQAQNMKIKFVISNWALLK